MFKFKCTVTRQGKSPVTRIFKCYQRPPTPSERKSNDYEAKDEAAKLIPPHLYRQALDIESIPDSTACTRWRKSSDWCSVILEII